MYFSFKTIEPVDFSRNDSQNNSTTSSTGGGVTGSHNNGTSQNDKSFSIYSSLHNHHRHQMGGPKFNNDIMRPRSSRSNDILSDDNSDCDDQDDCSDVDIIGDDKAFI